MPGLIHAVASQTQVALQSAAQIAATASGTGLDISDYDGLIAVTAVAPNIAGAPNVVVTVETSDTIGSGYTTVTGGTSPTWTAGAIANIFRVVLDTDALKRYVRTTITVTGGASPLVSAFTSLVGVKKYT